MATPRDFRGAYAASITPLTDGGANVDVDAIPPLVDWLAGAGLDGLLALGTTGEGILLRPDERRRAIAALVAGARGRIAVIAHCGAQTTWETADLAAHAAADGADAVAVIAPPYYGLDEAELLAHLTTAADACAPLPFFVYEFAARSGYAVPPAVIEQLRMRAPNLAGLKVSDSPWERVSPYLVEGLAVFVGAESLIHRALQAGAAGAVSGLAAALPEVVVSAVRERSDAATRLAADLRERISRYPVQAALKRLLAHRGVPVTGAVRAPLRELTAAELTSFDAEIPAILAAAGCVQRPAPA